MDLLTLNDEPELLLRKPDSLELKPGQIRTWVWDLKADATRERDMLDILSGDEVVRAQSFKFEKDRRRFVMARAGLRQILGGILGEAPEALRFEYGGRGKPQLVGQEEEGGLHFSLSHSNDMALVAAAWGMELGVDIEELREDASLGELAQVAFSAVEREWYLRQDEVERSRAFFQLWTLKEAVFKVQGIGLAEGLKSFHVLPRATNEALVVDYLTERALQGWRAANFIPAPGCQAALAYKNSANRDFRVASCSFFEYSS